MNGPSGTYSHFWMSRALLPYSRAADVLTPPAHGTAFRPCLCAIRLWVGGEDPSGRLARPRGTSLPVVEQHEAEDVLPCRLHRDGLPQLVAGAHHCSLCGDQGGYMNGGRGTAASLDVTA
jgi:hypothetical protein